MSQSDSSDSEELLKPVLMRGPRGGGLHPVSLDIEGEFVVRSSVEPIKSPSEASPIENSTTPPGLPPPRERVPCPIPKPPKPSKSSMPPKPPKPPCPKQAGTVEPDDGFNRSQSVEDTLIFDLDRLHHEEEACVEILSSLGNNTSAADISRCVGPGESLPLPENWVVEDDASGETKIVAPSGRAFIGKGAKVKAYDLLKSRFKDDFKALVQNAMSNIGSNGFRRATGQERVLRNNRSLVWSFPLDWNVIIHMQGGMRCLLAMSPSGEVFDSKKKALDFLQNTDQVLTAQAQTMTVGGSKKSVVTSPRAAKAPSSGSKKVTSPRVTTPRTAQTGSGSKKRSAATPTSTSTSTSRVTFDVAKTPSALVAKRPRRMVEKPSYEEANTQHIEADIFSDMSASDEDRGVDETAQPDVKKFSELERVRHAKHGPGVVKRVKGAGWIQVQFDRGIEVIRSPDLERMDITPKQSDKVQTTPTATTSNAGKGKASGGSSKKKQSPPAATPSNAGKGKASGGSSKKKKTQAPPTPKAPTTSEGGGEDGSGGKSKRKADARSKRKANPNVRGHHCTSAARLVRGAMSGSASPSLMSPPRPIPTQPSQHALERSALDFSGLRRADSASSSPRPVARSRPQDPQRGSCHSDLELIRPLQSRVSTLEREVEDRDEGVRIRDRCITLRDRSISFKDEVIERLDRSISCKDEVIERLHEVIERQQRVIWSFYESGDDGGGGQGI